MWHFWRVVPHSECPNRDRSALTNRLQLLRIMPGIPRYSILPSTILIRQFECLQIDCSPLITETIPLLTSLAPSGDGDDCTIGLIGAPVPTAVCGPDLTCITRNDEEHATCQYREICRSFYHLLKTGKRVSEGLLCLRILINAEHGFVDPQERIRCVWREWQRSIVVSRREHWVILWSNRIVIHWESIKRFGVFLDKCENRDLSLESIEFNFSSYFNFSVATVWTEMVKGYLESPCTRPTWPSECDASVLEMKCFPARFSVSHRRIVSSNVMRGVPMFQFNV